MTTKSTRANPPIESSAPSAAVLKPVIAAPTASPLLRPPSVVTKHLLMQVRVIAQHLSEIRRLETVERDILRIVMDIPSTPAEMTGDWENAWAFLCLQIIEGTNVEFALVEAPAYPHFEDIWLERVKGLKAYFIWNDSHNQDPLANYFAASAAIRQRLLAPRTDSAHDFDRVKYYLAEQYLQPGDSSLLDESKPATHRLIARKARQIFETTGHTDERANWFRARLYVSMFYENIVGAVLDHNELKTRTILKAFEFSKAPGNGYHIINGFEALVAINFLSPAIVREVLEHPDWYDFSMQPVVDWPDDLPLPTGLRFDRDNQQLIFEGVMTAETKDDLMARLPEPRHRAALEGLFIQSRLQPFAEQIL